MPKTITQEACNDKKSNVFDTFQKKIGLTLLEKIFFITNSVLALLFFGLVILGSGFKLYQLKVFILWLLFILIVFLIERGIKKIYLKIGKKKINTVLLMLFLIGAINSYINKGYFYSASNYFKTGFYFEKYDGVEAKKELLRLHPIGSDAYELMDTVKKAGADCTIYTSKVVDDIFEFEGKKHRGKKRINIKKEHINKVTDEISCSYLTDYTNIILPTWWYVHAEIKNDLVIIKKVSVRYNPWWGK